MTEPLDNRLERVMPAPGSLKVWKVEPVEVHEEDGSHSMLAVTCPHCGREAFVRLLWRKPIKVRGRSYMTRSCPYCFSTSKVPGRHVVRRRKK